MKEINIIGMGMSDKTVTWEALELIHEADILIGAKRLLNDLSYLNKPSYNSYLSNEIAEIIEKTDASKIAILVSGDVGFYSAAEKLVETLKEYKPNLISGISSVSYFFAKCNLPWKDAKLISCHGIDTNIVSSVRRNEYTFALTGKNIPDLGKELIKFGFGDLKVWVGENLGSEEEFISSCKICDLCSKEYSSLTVLIIENPNFDSRNRIGISDDEFIRGKVPMTKLEVRSVCMSKLSISPNDIAYDIGCGTGSVTIEMGLSAYDGKVFAFDKNEEAIGLLEQNCEKFHLDNVKAICGLAPECLQDLPIPNVVFIGGSSGNMDEIVNYLYGINNKLRFVITAVTIENAMAALNSLKSIGINGEIVQVAVSKGRKIGDLHMLMAQNPIFIISGCGFDEGNID
ncbi:precorrin-6y C5,15-methyltransferase (decarboxylating) subunit CbiE [Methanobrevibacter olleyae]|uniref:Probable cobalt-precorrin-6B C(15)-methyltransferase (decarboxylating) n=1 Tax=Methanobrevibacter olleyae TaxID=294671 RepID=A0A126QXD7_METOL|nr:precorrin-6y C5,15-methyltransferase (decarboxylating) subunit CbiE [Methanobrevibacter olleyae]AMK14800.1 precorrin-6Y C5,15-methyltransferase (decarboxylating) CbiET [Methanobrevibacter olleyae]